MPGWTLSERTTIMRCLRTHPVDSNRCERMARCIIRALARSRRGARVWYITSPGRACIAARPPGKYDWIDHVTVKVDDLFIDCLTGIDGHPAETYLRTYFEYPDALLFHEIDANKLKELCK